MKQTLMAMTAALALAVALPQPGRRAGPRGGRRRRLLGRPRWRRNGGRAARLGPGSDRRGRGSACGGPPPGGNLAARGGHWQGGGNWQQSRRHHRGPFVTYGFGAPYFYDYATPYSYYDGDDGCWAYRFVRGAYRRVWVCY